MRRRWILAIAVVVVGAAGCTRSSRATQDSQRPTSLATTTTSVVASTATSAAVDPPPVYRLTAVPREFSIEKLGVANALSDHVTTTYERPSVQADGVDSLRVSIVARRAAPGLDLLSVQTTASKADGAPVTLRRGRPALFFRVGNGLPPPHSRHGVVWEEQPGLYLEVYGYMDEIDLLSVADSATPAN